MGKSELDKVVIAWTR